MAACLAKFSEEKFFKKRGREIFPENEIKSQKLGSFSYTSLFCKRTGIKISNKQEDNDNTIQTTTIATTLTHK